MFCLHGENKSKARSVGAGVVEGSEKMGESSLSVWSSPAATSQRVATEYLRCA